MFADGSQGIVVGPQEPFGRVQIAGQDLNLSRIDGVRRREHSGAELAKLGDRLRLEGPGLHNPVIHCRQLGQRGADERARPAV